MPRRVTPAQLKQELRRRQQAKKRAVDRYNQEVRRVNAKNKKAVDDYNREVRQRQQKRKKAIADVNRSIDRYNRDVTAYNARVRQNRTRRKQEIDRLNRALSQSSATAPRHQSSVAAFQQSFATLEDSGAASRLPDDLRDLSEGEVANSAAALTALVEEPDQAPDVDDLKATVIGTELRTVEPELEDRWSGALYSLDPDNPDAARHFCTSAREMLDRLLSRVAPDEDVVEANPDYPKTPDGDVSRRARIWHCLASSGRPDESFVDFVDEDIENVIDLFREFNSGTHGNAGKFSITQLVALKQRVEDAILFVCQIAGVAPAR